MPVSSTPTASRPQLSATELKRRLIDGRKPFTGGAWSRLMRPSRVKHMWRPLPATYTFPGRGSSPCVATTQSIVVREFEPAKLRVVLFERPARLQHPPPTVSR